jgi:hypothetical protein
MPLLELFRPERPKPILNTANSYTCKYCDFSSYIIPLYRPADKMSSRMKKTKPKSKVKAAERNDLLSAILRSASTMTTSCSFYKTRGLVYKALPSVSSAYSVYIQNY